MLATYPYSDELGFAACAAFPHIWHFWRSRPSVIAHRRVALICITHDGRRPHEIAAANFVLSWTHSVGKNSPAQEHWSVTDQGWCSPKGRRIKGSGPGWSHRRGPCGSLAERHSTATIPHIRREKRYRPRCVQQRQVAAGPAMRRPDYSLRQPGQGRRNEEAIHIRSVIAS